MSSFSTSSSSYERFLLMDEDALRREEVRIGGAGGEDADSVGS